MANFTPVITTPKRPPHKRITGTPRIVKDLTAKIHSNIQRWNTIHMHGLNILKSITTVKVDETYPEDLEELCDELQKDLNQLNQVVLNLRACLQQITSAVSLRKKSTTLFSTWPTEKFVEVAQLIYDSYTSELLVKRKILENVAHDYRDSSKMLHLSAWVHQSMIPHDLNVCLESLLVETGHRCS